MLDAIGRCGLACAVCCHAAAGCAGCRAGGGDEACHQRRCCGQRGLAGCWECADFPCDQGYLAMPEWRGLCVGCGQVIAERGRERFVAAVKARWGASVDYGNHRFKSAEETCADLAEPKEAR